MLSRASLAGCRGSRAVSRDSAQFQAGRANCGTGRECRDGESRAVFAGCAMADNRRKSGAGPAKQHQMPAQGAARGIDHAVGPAWRARHRIARQVVAGRPRARLVLPGDRGLGARASPGRHQLRGPQIDDTGASAVSGLHQARRIVRRADSVATATAAALGAGRHVKRALAVVVKPALGCDGALQRRRRSCGVRGCARTVPDRGAIRPRYCPASQRSASSAAMQPMPALVTA